jgi:hypothetical protein
MDDSNGPKFTCAACGRQFKWKLELAGKKAKCKCGAAVAVPVHAPTAPPPVDDDIVDAADLPEPITPRSQHAPRAPHATGAMSPPPLPPQQIACPICNTPAPPTAVLCTNCGFNYRTGVRLPGASRGSTLAYAGRGANTSGGIAADSYAQAAKAAWMAPLIAFLLGCCTVGAKRGAPSASLVISMIQLLLILAGVGLGIFALTGVGKHGSEGILAPAIVGLVLNVGIIALNVIMVILLTTGKFKPPAGPPGAGGTGGPAPPARTVPIMPRSR